MIVFKPLSLCSNELSCLFFFFFPSVHSSSYIFEPAFIFISAWLDFLACITINPLIDVFCHHIYHYFIACYIIPLIITLKFSNLLGKKLFLYNIQFFRFNLCLLHTVASSWDSVFSFFSCFSMEDYSSLGMLLVKIESRCV